jgi:hypothetical protein
MTKIVSPAGKNREIFLIAISSVRFGYENVTYLISECTSIVITWMIYLSKLDVTGASDRLQSAVHLMVLVTCRDLVHEQPKMRAGTSALLHHNKLWQKRSDTLDSHQSSPKRSNDLPNAPVPLPYKMGAIPKPLDEDAKCEELHDTNL